MVKIPSILLITLDTLRADHLGCYGYKRNTSPHIDEIAKEGTIFTQAIAQDTWTAPSMTSMLTSTYPFFHNVTYFGDTIDVSLVSLPELLKEKGYRTALIGPYVLSKIKGFSRGFDFFDTGVKDIFLDLVFNLSRHVATFNILTKFILRSLPFGFDRLVNIYTEIHNERANIITQKAIEWLKVNGRDKPFFLWLNYFDTHGPYMPPSPYSQIFLRDGFEQKTNQFLPILWKGMNGLGGISKYQTHRSINNADYYISQYDGAIRYMDEQIDILLSFLEKLKLDDDILFIISANNGEYLGEHDIYFCHTGIPFEAVIRVPLIIKYNRIVSKGKIVNPQVQSVDIAPTVLDILTIDKPKTFQGNSLLPLILGEKESHTPYAFIGNKKAPALRTSDYKLIYIDYREIEKFESEMKFRIHSSHYIQLKYLFGLNRLPKYLFFDLKKDPAETKNLIDVEKEKAEIFKKILSDLIYRQSHYFNQELVSF